MLAHEDKLVVGAVVHDGGKNAGILTVDLAGHLSRDLLNRLSRTSLLLYPNTCPETFCIATIEAQASGCVVITSALAGLNETVENGTTGLCIEGDPESGEYQRQFIDAVHWLLGSPSLLREFSRAARKRAFQIYDRGRVDQHFRGDTGKGGPSTLVRPADAFKKRHEYLRNGNLSAPSRVVTALEQTPFLRGEVETLKGRLNTWM